MGEGHQDKASVPTSVFTKPQPHRTPLENAPEESHQHRILQNEGGVQASGDEFLRTHRRLQRRVRVASNSQFPIG